MGFYLGIDLGTSYFKAGIFDNQGKLVGLGRHLVEKSKDDGIICELSIAAFWETLRKCVDQAIEKAEINSNEIVSVSYSSQANSFVLLDKSNKPLTPLILWPDQRAGKLSSALQSLVNNNDFQHKTGLGILPGIQSMAAKISWFQDNQPEIWQKTKSIMSISDFMTFSLTGQKVSDFSTASMTGLLNITDDKWWDKALTSLSINENYLNKPKRTGTYAGVLTEEGAKLLGLSASTQFFLGGLDHHMVAVGADLPDSDNISESTGTVLACVNYQKGYSPRNGINIAPGLERGFYFQMAFNENGATALEWYEKNYAPEFSIHELLEMAKKIEPNCNGLIALPCADKLEGLTGFQNISNKHTHGHFVRAILESTSFSLKQLVQELDVNNSSKAVISSGGGARSQLWIQIKADMLDKTFIVPECNELACKGAAKIAQIGISHNKKRSQIY